MRIEAEVSRGRGLAWTIGATGLAGLLLLILAMQREVSSASWFAIAAVVTALSFVALTRGAPEARGTKRRVAVDRRGLSVDGALVVPRHALLRARVLDEGTEHAVLVETRGFARTYTLRVGSARSAQGLADVLEQPPEEISEFDALPPWAHRMRWLAIVLTTSPWILFNILRHMPGFTILVVLALYGVIALPMVLPQKITVGEDGLLLRWAGRRRFIPFSALVSAESTPLGVKLELEDDAIEIRLGHRADSFGARREAMLARIEEGMEAHRALEPAEDAALLARGTRSLDDWMRDLEALGLGDAGGYRTIAMPRERLWAVLENARAEASAREGAALALRSSLHDDERERIAAIAQKSASPRLRVALDAVSSLTDEPRLRVVLEEAAELESELSSLTSGARQRGSAPYPRG